MTEIDTLEETGRIIDPVGQKVGIEAAVLAVFLTLASIASLRSHTEGIVLSTGANDQWQYYQSRRARYHTLELGEDLMKAMRINDEATQGMLVRYKTEKHRYQEEAQGAQAAARRIEQDATRAERRARRFDYGEGLLEIALVLTSLFFISRKKFFPFIGAAAGTVGLCIAITGLIA